MFLAWKMPFLEGKQKGMPAKKGDQNVWQLASYQETREVDDGRYFCRSR